jgi:hypothetical protein
MLRKWFSKDPRELLPWYINGTLGQRERRVVERWLVEEPGAAEQLAAWRHLRAAVHDQPRREPPAAVRQRLMLQVASHQPQRLLQRRMWIWGAVLSLVVLVVLWVVVRPGIVLQWEVNPGAVTAFRVYRAPVGSADFELLRQVAARPGDREYTYVDARPMPLQTYVYQVEAVEQEGDVVSSPRITASALEALPAQLGVIFISLSVGYALVFLARLWLSPFRIRRWTTAEGLRPFVRK